MDAQEGPSSASQISSQQEGAVNEVNVRNFVAARASEIASLTVQIRNSGGPSSKGLSFQHVSKHMRRRAVSHNPKRLPSRLRQIHLAQVQKSSGGVRKLPKRPRRKFRKRSKGDILEYNRRQLYKPESSWLETHIWHAKRFHMKTIWGKKLAVSPTAKCFRSLFKAARSGAIMRDVSYLGVLEVTGNKQVIIDGMNKIITPSRNQYPVGCAAGAGCAQELVADAYTPTADLKASQFIGRIKYLWVACEKQEIGKLILWHHPELKESLRSAISEVFSMTVINPDEKLTTFPPELTKDEQKILWKTFQNFEYSSQDGLLQLKDLDSCIGRIRITGPKTLPVLQQILKVGLFPSDCEDKKFRQEEMWKSVGSLSNVPNFHVFPLNVIDPRLDLPKKRSTVSKSLEEGLESRLPTEQADLMCRLWDEKVRRDVLHNKLSDVDLGKERSQNLIPGTELPEDDNTSVIPVLVVFRSGPTSGLERVHFEGADLIVPGGWMMPFWVALSYRCVRAYGIEYGEYMSFEDDNFLGMNTLRFPPDSVGYLQEEVLHERISKEKYFSRSAGKRPNLIKLICPSPFRIDWKRFISFVFEVPFESFDKVSVLRTPQDYVKLQHIVRNVGNVDQSALDDTLLVPVRLKLLSGTVHERSAICLPTEEDLQLLSTNNSSQITEQPMTDYNEPTRDQLHHEHQKKMARLRKKRKAVRKATKGTLPLGVIDRLNSKDLPVASSAKVYDSSSEVVKFNNKMNELWLIGEPYYQVSCSSQSKKLIGFITYAHESYVEGKYGAVGYITAKDLKRLFNEQHHKSTPLVLVRDWSRTLNYNWAELRIL